jgi:hypothetical protein
MDTTEPRNTHLTGLLRKQTEILLKNLDDQIAAADLDVLIDGLPNSRYLFHTLHSLDRNFINPDGFSEPALSVCGINPEAAVIDETRPDFKRTTGSPITRQALASYASYIRTKIDLYFGTLDDTMLGETPPGCRFTRLTLMLGQFRHLMWHLGLSSGLTVSAGSGWPEYTGLFR